MTDWLNTVSTDLDELEEHIVQHLSDTTDKSEDFYRQSMEQTKQDISK